VTRLATWSLRHPSAALAALLVLTAGLAAGLPQLRSDVGYRAFLGADHPSVRRFDAFLDRFGGGLPMAAVYRCDDAAPCASVFDPGALEMAARVAGRLAASPVVVGVESPATTLLVAPSPLGPLPRHLVEEGEVADDRESLAEAALSDPGWVGQLVSADGRTGAVVVELEGSSSETAIRAYEALDAALAPAEALGFRFARVGGPVEFVVAGGELERATARMVPVMVLLVGAILWLLFRSLIAAAVGLVTVGIAVVWTMGMLGWLGWAQNSLTQTLPPLVLVIGVCDAVHLLALYAGAASREPGDSRAERRARIERVAADVAPPCTMTTLTTAAGFLSFTTAPLESFNRFGVVAALGVTAALVLTFSLLPLLLLAVPSRHVRAADVSRRWDGLLHRLVSLAEGRARTVLAATLVLAVGAGGGLTRLRVDASFEELYGAQSRVVQWVDFVAEHLRRPDTLEIELRLPEDRELAEPGTLAVIEELSQRLEAEAIFGEARSVLTPLHATRRLLEPESHAPYAPDTERNRGLLAVVRAFGAGVGEDGLGRWVDAERRRVRISVDSDKPPQEVMRRVLAEVDDWLADLPPGWSGRATGPLAVVADMVESIRSTQLRSFAAAFAAVLVLVTLYLRSFGWALLAMLPTVLPVLLTLGTMGALGLPLDVGSAMVAAVVLGVAVDDTIHLLDHFRRRRAVGASPERALREAVAHVGRALVTTSVALAIGFSALALSPWQSVASFGAVAAVAIAAALVAALVVLPSLVLGIRRAPDGD